MTPTRSWRRLWLAGVVLALTAGCGAGSSASERVPKLGTSLDRIDAAIVEGDHDAARALLDELVATATRARDSDRLGAGAAARIVDAAERLQSALPDETTPDEAAPDETTPVEPQPTPEPSRTETSAPELDGESSEHEAESDRGKSKGKGKGKGKSKSRDD